jgi:hypothetical protein
LQALDALPHGQRAVIVLRYLSQLSEAETAATLEISTGTVKSQTARALARMREALTPEPARPQPGDNMNHVDDTELIDGLRARLLDRTADVHAPDRLADDARRLARRRATTRTVAVGIPVLAAAGVATVLLASSGSPAAHTTTGPAAPGVNAPVAQAQDTPTSSSA